MAFLRAIIAVHGPMLDELQRSAGLSNDDWLRIDKQVHFDVLNSEFIFEVMLRKIDGSDVKLTMTADSLLALTTQLVSMAVTPRSPAAFSDSAVDQFVEALTSFQELFDTADDEESVLGADPPDGDHAG